MRLLVHIVVSRAEPAVVAFLGVPAEDDGTGTPVLPGPPDLIFLSARLSALALLLARTCGVGLWTREERPAPSPVTAIPAIPPLPLPVAPFHDTS